MRTLSLALVGLLFAACDGCDAERIEPLERDAGPLPVGGEGEGEAGEGEGEAGEGEGEAGEGEGEPACLPAELVDQGDPDKPRVVLVSHGFGPGSGDLHDIRSLTLGGETLVDDGVRLDVATRVERIAFAPSGRFAIVLGKTGDGPEAEGVVASVRVDDASSLTIVDSLVLPIFGPADVRVARALSPGDDALRVYVIDHDTTEATGVHALRLTCDGALALDVPAFHGIRLAASLAFLGDTRALLVGGQAVFDPIDDDDIRLLSLGDDTAQVAAFDIFTDFVDLTRIAANAAGTRVIVPNGSPFSAEGGHILLLGVAGDVVTELDRVTDYPASYEAMMAPDDASVLVASFEEDRVVAFALQGDQLVEGDSVPVALAEQMDVVTRGISSGVVVAAAVTDVKVLRIDGPGSLVDLATVALGDGNENITTAIAVQP